MSKLCLKTGGQRSSLGSFRSAEAFLHWQRMGVSRIPAALVFPATQQRQAQQSAGNARYGHITHRARLSPLYSIFNRLDGFVHQLQGSKDFFAVWPERLCNKIRQNTNNNSTVISGAGDKACWNGRDFRG